MDKQGNLKCNNASLSGNFKNGSDPMLGEAVGTVITRDGEIRTLKLDVYTDKANSVGGIRVHPNKENTHVNNVRAQLVNHALSFQDEENGLREVLHIGTTDKGEHGYIKLLSGIVSMENGTISLNNGELNVGHINATGYGYFDDYVRATNFVNASSKELKENIYKLKGNSKKKSITRKALDIVKNTDICEYNFKGNEHKQIGVIIGSGYNTPDEILSEDKNGVDLYSMISTLYRAFQENLEEQQKIIDKQNNRMQKLEERLDEYEKDNKNIN